MSHHIMPKAAQDALINGVRFHDPLTYNATMRRPPTEIDHEAQTNSGAIAASSLY